ncbi:hypothetical protein PXK30_09415 [Phaeobacter gallaeciensis]|uniref:hypothetical protein n=1 Tax=Phaeobacter gallaeciensis TaxID=60890 RepID=UPI00237FA0CA|nr:hypothetical protein [Phaeobacter gallaeciensis]MDE4303660.1 hypothetical protein [Phaeobacter gallaeciensis]MDE4307859.1 hypothetical protein [Phaeobacter gallaeciensis]MDE4312317.1 hypothetical protein [Phaeobacter gallaeciensis]MDE4316788.1 hypothetical protein [Phaeobacter gallaeciensis]MDE4321251.1 hypothetical protein [Phaeobacter gallaeciensis]
MSSTDLKLGIDARQGEAGARKYVAALNSIKAALSGLDRTADGTFASLKKGLQVTPNKAAETALKGTATAAKQAEAAAQRLTTSVTNAMTTAGTQTAKLKAQFAALADQNGIRKAEQALARFQARAGKAGNTAALGAAKADYRATVTGLQAEARAQQEAASAAAKHAASLDSLRKRHDETFAISKNYETKLEQITTLEREGALTAEKAAAARARAAQQLAAGAIATGKYGQSLKINQFHVANFNNVIDDMSGKARRFDMRQISLQLSQVAQQGSVTGNYLQALAVQIPDLALGFGGPLVTMAGAAAGVLGTVLVGAMTKTSDESEKLKNQVHALSTALDGLEQNSTASAAQIEAHLKKAFGSVAGDVQSLIEDLRDAEFSVLSHQMRREVEKATTSLNSLGGAFEVVMHNFLNPGEMDSGYVKQMQEIVNAGQMTNAEFQRLDAAVKSVFTSQDVNEFVSNLSSARTIAEDIGGPVGDQIGNALLQAAKDAGVLNRVTSEAATSGGNLATELSAGAKQVLELNKIDMSTGLSDATKQAAELAANLNISLNAALNLKNLQDSKVYSGRGGDPRQFGNGYTPPQLSTTRTGGGGGGRNVTDELTRTTQAMREQELALTALREGRYSSEEAARLWAQAMIDGNGSIDAQTQSMLRNIDAMAQRNETLRNTPEDFAQNIGQGVEQSLEQAISSAMNGNGNVVLNFARSIQSHVSSAVAKSLAERITSGLKLDNLFSSGGQIAAMQMEGALVSGGATAAAQIGQAVATGQAAAGGVGGGLFGGGGGLFGGAGGGGGFWGTALQIGMSLFGFSEGGYSDRPGMTKHTVPLGAFKNAPHYAEGTANTSNGIPAVLHPNEAVVPLSRGRKIPVEMGNGGGKSVVVGDIVTNVNVEGDASSSDSIEIARVVGESVDGRIRTILAEEMAYGGTLNRRGGM